jgi:hypothetical protein
MPAFHKRRKEMTRKTHETQTTTQPELVAVEEPALNSNNVLNFTSTLAELRKIDPHLVRQRAGRRDRNGNVHMVEYVEWHTVADILDQHAANWEHKIKDIKPIGDIITVTVAITINGVTREGIGTGKTASETGIKKAEHDALKRAAVKFGIARELYKKEFDTIDHDESVAEHEQPRTSVAPMNAVARNLGDMVTSKQLNMIRAIAREKEIDAEAVCGEMFACRIEEISKRAASDLIDRLQGMPGAVPMRKVG